MEYKFLYSIPQPNAYMISALCPTASADQLLAADETNLLLNSDLKKEQC